MFILYATVCVVGLLILSQVNKSNEKRSVTEYRNSQTQTNVHFARLDFQGHKYIIWSEDMGGQIVHDTSCPCLKNKEIS